MHANNFNIDEVLEIAEQIERNGAKYYRIAADSVTDAEQKSFLTEMAEMEDSHEKYFAWLRVKFREYDKGESLFDPESEVAAYLHAIADGTIFDFKTDPASKVRGKAFEEILRQAIQDEKDTVLFYVGLKKAMLDESERQKTDAIIDEEMSHVRILSQRLASFLRS